MAVVGTMGSPGLGPTGQGRAWRGGLCCCGGEQGKLRASWQG